MYAVCRSLYATDNDVEIYEVANLKTLLSKR